VPGELGNTEDGVKFDGNRKGDDARYWFRSKFKSVLKCRIGIKGDTSEEYHG